VRKPLVVTIDGPAGSGKTVCGRLAALQLGYQFLSSGIYYRAVTYEALRSGVDLQDEEALAALASSVKITLKNEPEGLRVEINGEDCTEALKQEKVTAGVRYVAEKPAVRSAVNEVLRRFAEKHTVVAEGRDMGSVVFPAADCKFYLEASRECRVERRRRELEALGVHVEPEALRRSIEERDQRDKTRPISPLVVPQGAEVIDTTDLTVDQVVERIVRRVYEKQREKAERS